MRADAFNPAPMKPLFRPSTLTATPRRDIGALRIFSLFVLIEEKPLLSFVSAVVSQPPRASFPFQPLQLVSHCSCVDTSAFPMRTEELAKRSTLPSSQTSISSKKIVIHAPKVHFHLTSPSDGYLHDGYQSYCKY